VRPKLLDLFCGAGGCAAGYVRAGFDVTGVDVRPQPRYLLSGATAFVQADALEYVREHGREFDAIHASPPCQAYSKATAWRGDRGRHPDLIAPTRQALLSCGRPHVIENVEQARRLLRSPVMVCGSMVGLRVRRHRYFELSWCPLLMLPPCRHRHDDLSFDHGGKQPESAYREAMGCGWMTVHESRQAIPPAYTEMIGKELMRALSRREAS
jgi:hypothetical protein